MSNRNGKRRDHSAALPVKDLGKNSKSILAFIEEPLFLAAVGLAGGVVGLALYAPVLVVCGICILLAFHQSQIVARRRLLVRFAAYSGVICVVVFALWAMNLALADQSRRATLEIANVISERIKVLNKGQQVTDFHAVNGDATRVVRKPVREVSRSHPETSSAAPQTRDSSRPPPPAEVMPAGSSTSQAISSQPQHLPPPRAVTLAEIQGDIERQRAACEEKLSAEPPCRGDDLSKCGDKKLLEWGKPLLDHVGDIYNHLELDSKMAQGYSGDKFIRAMDAASNDAADKYRQCCAADALRYHKELAHRVGGGKENLEFYTWSEQLLSPVKSKDWKAARPQSDTNIMHADNDLQSLARELELKINIRCINSARPTN